MDTALVRTLDSDRFKYPHVSRWRVASPQVSARDAVHLAVMEQHGIERILSFDSGFDGFPGITRMS